MVKLNDGIRGTSGDLAHQHFRFNDDTKSDIQCYGFHFGDARIMMMRTMLVNGWMATGVIVSTSQSFSQTHSGNRRSHKIIFT